MRLLVIAKNLYGFPGGAERSLLTLMKELSPSHMIKALFLAQNNKLFTEDNIEFISIKGKARTFAKKFLTLKSILFFLIKTLRAAKHFNPDFIITQLTFSPFAILIANYLNVRSIIFLRSYEAICFTESLMYHPCIQKSCFSCARSKRKKILYPIVWTKGFMLRWALKKSSLVIANSQFMSDIFKEYLNIDSKVVYPFVNFNKIISREVKIREFITFVTPKILKGLDIFIEIAKRLPNRKFLVAGIGAEIDRPDRLYGLKNVDYLGKVADMRTVYAITRVLLVPSIWPEPFGRVCVEAMANGIPCIASNVGGIKEAVGDAGILIDDPYNIDSWTRAIESLDDEKTYKYFSQKDNRVVDKFNLNKGIDQFLKILHSSFPNQFY